MNLFSITDCAKELGVKEHQIAYAHRAKHLAEPALRVHGKRVYTEADLRAMADYFGRSNKQEETK